jgi:peptidoglycan hydrolase-like protein with peptidoglycan-binding domain
LDIDAQGVLGPMHKKLLGSLLIAAALLLSFSSAAGAEAASASSHTSKAAAFACWNGPNHPNHPVIGTGSQGWDVIEAQCRLREWAGCAIAVDGVFGSKTRQCVVAVQSWCRMATGRSDIAVDGVIGPVTWRMVHAYSCWA